jgi:hypothetical protein
VRFDWVGLEAAFTEQITGFVRRMRVEHPDDRIYGAAVYGFYAESGGVIAWPPVGVASEETLASVAKDEADAVDLRWSPAHWPWQLDPTEVEDEWAAKLEAVATADGGTRWDAIHDSYLRTVVKACRAARRQLVADGTVDEGFLVVAMDEAWELVPLALTKAEVRRHFPEIDVEARELARLGALPVDERVRELVTIVESHTSNPVAKEKAITLLRGVGAAAGGAAVEQLRRSRQPWQWARLIAELDTASPEAIDALTRVMTNERLPEPDRAWAAAALARLGRMDLVAERLRALPDEVVTAGLTAPYTAFRDDGAHGRLDYAPLEQALATHPDQHDAVLARLAPGSSFCAIDASEIDTALAALGSPWPAIRRHALFVLSDAPLRPEQRSRYAADLDRLRAGDPDAAVRDAAALVA